MIGGWMWLINRETLFGVDKAEIEGVDAAV
jgi:hypothetical protein